jgi:thiol-disulfide isomerase/thioredoxin
MLLQILMLSVATATTGLTGVKYGAPPPDVPLPIGTGTERVAAYRGKVVILHFWATWCHYCLDELPKFAKLKQTYGKRVAVITVSNEPPDVAASYLRLWNMELPIVEDTTSTVFKAYGIGPLPDTVVVDRSGAVVYAEVGVSNFDDLHRAIEQALGP